MGYRIIEPSREKLELLVDLCLAHAIFEKSHYSRENKVESLSEDLFGVQPKLYCRVVEVGGKYVGYITWMQQYSTWDAMEYLYMDCLYLEKEYRGLGIGEVLVDHMKSFAQSNDVNLIQWQTPDFNLRAIKFYNRIGATCKAKQRFFLIIN